MEILDGVIVVMILVTFFWSGYNLYAIEQYEKEFKTHKSLVDLELNSMLVSMQAKYDTLIKV